MSVAIDLNADIGESYGAWRMGNDEALLALVSSANIACGFHAGDPRVMADSVALCRRHGVRIGAHPSLPDREGFGRRHIDLSASEIYQGVLYQVGALAAFARAQGVTLRHVKPHGALYNRAARERVIADAIACAVRDFDPALALVGLAGTQLVAAGVAAGLTTLAEAFADRRYMADGSLVARSEARAVIDDPREAAQQALAICLERQLVCIDGTRIALGADTLCVHGDGPHALRIGAAVREELLASGVVIRAHEA